MLEEVEGKAFSSFLRKNLHEYVCCALRKAVCAEAGYFGCHFKMVTGPVPQIDVHAK